MKILAVDTSTLTGSIALVEGPNLVAEISLHIDTTYSERLIHSIEWMLTASRWTLESVEGLAVAIGPGSFTGLRIGLATLKGMASAKNLPLVGVSSLAVLGHNLASASEPVVAVMDAKRQEVYAAGFQFEKGRLREQWLADGCFSPAVLSDRLDGLQKFWLVGDGAKKMGLEKALYPEDVWHVPRAGVLAGLARERLMNGEGCDFSALVPNYCRPSDAEIKQSSPRRRGSTECNKIPD